MLDRRRRRSLSSSFPRAQPYTTGACCSQQVTLRRRCHLVGDLHIRHARSSVERRGTTRILSAHPLQLPPQNSLMVL